jgi:hypothetical protein
MIEAICNELQCLPGDLFETIVTEASDEEINAIQSPFDDLTTCPQKQHFFSI